METNVDWRLLPENSKLWARTREWWESLHISHSNNSTFPPITEKQFGGNALFTINSITHRVIGKGNDETGLGRWVWTRLRGKHGHNLIIITAYRPNPPSAGVMGAYAQQAKYFNSIGRNACPRKAFLTDLALDINKFKTEGCHIIVMLDGNEDMQRGQVSNTFQELQLREVILQCHGNKAPATYRQNTKEVPIDGIWASLGISIRVGGYFDFDDVISGTDHRTLWINIDYKIAFGYDGTRIPAKPSARKLNNRNPNIRDNFNHLRKKCAEKCSLLERIIILEEKIDGELTLANRKNMKK